jgi:superfamily II DNA/RNA helicase
MSATRQGFAALGVPSDLDARLAAAGIDTPFPIQSAVIPAALTGRDVTGRAPTGSGKTLAFGLPLVARLRPARHRRPTGLVLVPTRELASQITAELGPLVRRRGHEVVSVYGGVAYGAQRRALDAGAELCVACPGRLEDLIDSGLVKLDDISFVVVDEADRMADMGFLPAVRRILALTNVDRQVLLFSATSDRAVTSLAAAIQRDPIVHEIGTQGPDIANARHVFWRTPSAERAATTAAAIDVLGATIVFCRTRHGADRLVKQLQRLGTTAAAIHGGRSQPQRDRALRSFARGEVRSLIATDVAARGVHVEGVEGVVHFDPPHDTIAYIHRSGRTARAGARGVVVSLVDPGATGAARRLQASIGIAADITPVDLDGLIHTAPPAGAGQGAPSRSPSRREPAFDRRRAPNRTRAGGPPSVSTVRDGRRPPNRRSRTGSASR